MIMNFDSEPTYRDDDEFMKHFLYYDSCIYSKQNK